MAEIAARILHLEDRDDDAYFVQNALQEDSILGELRRVQDVASYRAALLEFDPDVIVADFQLPDIDGMDALSLARELRPDTPFIFVTGYLGEEVAAETLKEGATDYVLKDRLARLPSAIRRALHEAEHQKTLGEAQASLVRDEHLHRAVAEMATDFAYSMEISDEGLRLEWITGAFDSITGYVAEDATSELLREMLHPDDRETTEERFLSVVDGDVRDVQFRIITRSGEERWLRACARPVRDDEGRLVRVFGAAQDITQLRAAAAGLEHLSSLLRSTVEAAGAGILVTSLDGQILYSNELILDMWGISRGMLGSFNRMQLLEWSANKVKDPEVYLERGVRPVGDSDEIELLDGRVFERTVKPRYMNGKPAGAVISMRDVTAARLTTNLLAEADRKRRHLQDRMFEAQEEERHKIAGDIHDDTVQVMAAAALRLDMLSQKLKDPEHLAMLDRLRATVRTSIDRLRLLMFELRPPALDREGLAAAVQTYLDRVEEESELVTELENRLTIEPSEKVRLMVYRIVQEAMTNARKHAKATNVRICLETFGDTVVATVTDDGQGFELKDSLASPVGHIGISAMRERAAQGEGHLRIRTAPGQGTTVEARLPLFAPEPALS